MAAGKRLPERSGNSPRKGDDIMSISRAVLLTAALAVSACAHVETVEEGLAKLRGQPVQNVVTRLGPPGAQQTTPTGGTYSWTQEGTYDVQVTQTTTQYATGIANTAQTTSVAPRQQSCTLNLSTDSRGIITAVSQQGPNAACAALSRKATGQP